RGKGWRAVCSIITSQHWRRFVMLCALLVARGSAVSDRSDPAVFVETGFVDRRIAREVPYKKLSVVCASGARVKREDDLSPNSEEGRYQLLARLPGLESARQKIEEEILTIRRSLWPEAERQPAREQRAASARKGVLKRRRVS